MRDEDKPFVLYRRGAFNFTIVPRGVKGWVQFAIWMVLLAPPAIAFALYAEAHEGRPEFAIALALFLLATLVWGAGGMLWMKARAEVIDVDALLRQKRDAGQAARPKGTRRGDPRKP